MKEIRLWPPPPPVHGCPGAVFGCSPSVPNRPQPPLCGQTAAVTVNLIQSLYHPHFVAPKDEIEKWEAVQSSFTAPILGLCHHFHAFIPNQMTLVSYTAFCWMALWSRAQLLSPYFGGLPLMCAGYCPPPSPSVSLFLARQLVVVVEGHVPFREGQAPHLFVFVEGGKRTCWKPAISSEKWLQSLAQQSFEIKVSRERVLRK